MLGQYLMDKNSFFNIDVNEYFSIFRFSGLKWLCVELPQKIKMRQFMPLDSLYLQKNIN